MRASWKLGLTQLHGSSAGLLCRLGCNTMVSSVQQIATRAFVSVLVVLARSYDVALAVSRDSSAEDLLKAYSKWLWKVPLVFTANYTTRNLDLLQRNDFLGGPENRVLIELSGPLLP